MDASAPDDPTAGDQPEAVPDGETTTTTDHDEVRRWAEERGGRAAVVPANGEELRIDFAGDSGEPDLRPIAWEEFFERFERKGLALLHDRGPHDYPHRFFRLVPR